MDKSWQTMPKLREICRLVEIIRLRQGIVPTDEHKIEPSCIMFGEFHNLVFFQLIPTTNFQGSWNELKDSPEIVAGVLDQLRSLVNA